MDKIFQALADQNRIEILKLLNEGNMTAGDIATNFGISKPAISHHLNILKNNKLINSQKRGQEVIYSLDLRFLQEFMLNFIDVFDNK